MAFVIPMIRINGNTFMKERTLYIYMIESEKYRVIVLNF